MGLSVTLSTSICSHFGFSCLSNNAIVNKSLGGFHLVKAEFNGTDRLSLMRIVIIRQ